MEASPGFTHATQGSKPAYGIANQDLLLSSRDEGLFFQVAVPRASISDLKELLCMHHRGWDLSLRKQIHFI